MISFESNFLIASWLVRTKVRLVKTFFFLLILFFFSFFIWECDLFYLFTSRKAIYFDCDFRVIMRSRNLILNKTIQVRFKVKDSGMFRDKLIGFATVPAKRIATGEVIDEWFSVRGSKGKPLKANIAIRLQITFTPCHKNPTYLSGITNNYGLKESYFPWRHGGKLRLYQDAHVIDGMVPEIKLEGGRDFEHNKCWEDICHAIVEAHHFVYIVGWSISHKVKLVRKPTATRPLPNGGDFNLGELLKYKSEEGVRVVVLVWEDKTSHSKFFIKTVYMDLILKLNVILL